MEEEKVHCGYNGLLARQVCWGQQEELSRALCHLWAVGFVAGSLTLPTSLSLYCAFSQDYFGAVI